MLGTLRFFLAALVALSHTDWRFHGLNLGESAVVGFYLISGYVVTGLLRTHYTRFEQLIAFYQDRAIRILPHYLLICGLTLLWYNWAQPNGIFFLAHAPGWVDLFNNLLVIPLNFYLFNHADRFTLVPPAWSLGAEIQFYLFLPLILLNRRRPLALIGSLAVFALAIVGMLDSDLYAYRLLPGVLFLFLIGSALYDWHHHPDIAAGRRVAGIWLAVLLAVLMLRFTHQLERPHASEVAVGLLVVLPLLHTLAPLARKRWDDWLGNLSYGVFLNHFLLIWTLFGTPPHTRFERLELLCLSVALAALLYHYVEKPVLTLRYRLRLKPAV